MVSFFRNLWLLTIHWKKGFTRIHHGDGEVYILDENKMRFYNKRLNGKW